MKSSSEIPTKTLYADEILQGLLDERARKLIETIRAEWAADERGTLRRTERNRLIGCGPTRGRELEQGPLPAYLDGGARLTPTSSVYIYKIDRVLASFPLNEPARKSPQCPSHTSSHSRPCDARRCAAQTRSPKANP